MIFLLQYHFFSVYCTRWIGKRIYYYCNNHLQFNTLLLWYYYLLFFNTIIMETKRKIAWRSSMDYIEIWPFENYNDALDCCRTSWRDTNLIREFWNKQMETTTKTMTKLQLIYEICYFTKTDIDNHLSRANDLQWIIREICIVNRDSLNFVIVWKNTSWSGFSPVKWKIVVKNNTVEIYKEAKKCTLEGWYIAEAWKTTDIYALID